MSSKLSNRSVRKYFLSFVALNLIMPSVAFADTSNGSFSISLQVVPKCNTPNISNTGSSQWENTIQHLDIKCSAQAKPAEVAIFAIPAVTQTVNTSQMSEHQNDTLNILVSY